MNSSASSHLQWLTIWVFTMCQGTWHNILKSCFCGEEGHQGLNSGPHTCPVRTFPLSHNSRAPSEVVFLSIISPAQQKRLQQGVFWPAVGMEGQGRAGSPDHLFSRITPHGLWKSLEPVFCKPNLANSHPSTCLWQNILKEDKRKASLGIYAVWFFWPF